MATEDAATTEPARRGARLGSGELGAWRGFLSTHAALTRQLDAELLAAHDLPLSHYEVLLYLCDSPKGEMRMAELADSVLLSRSGLTRLVDRLERDGLVRREVSPGDARGLNAVVTDVGRERFADARKTHLDGVRRSFLDHLDDAEMRTLAALWQRMASGSPDAPDC